MAVPRDAGLAVFERNLVLLEEGRVESAQVPLQEDASAVLHLVLGVQQLALIEWSQTPRGAAGPVAAAPPVAAEVFPDFGAWS